MIRRLRAGAHRVRRISGETIVDLVVGKDPWMRLILERRVWMKPGEVPAQRESLAGDSS